uniref:Uncharacterized protein n=1 Tax=Urocitellus parryii TaxID=9999 RepID=A0A8D2HLT8_UROPR
MFLAERLKVQPHLTALPSCNYTNIVVFCLWISKTDAQFPARHRHSVKCSLLVLHTDVFSHFWPCTYLLKILPRWIQPPLRPLPQLCRSMLSRKRLESFRRSVSGRDLWTKVWSSVTLNRAGAVLSEDGPLGVHFGKLTPRAGPSFVPLRNNLVSFPSYLASDLEEDNQAPKQDIFHFLYGKSYAQSPLFHKLRYQFICSMGWNTRVSREECEEIQAYDPELWVWGRDRTSLPRSPGTMEASGEGQNSVSLA